MVRVILVVVFVGACGHKNATCERARTELNGQIAAALKTLDENATAAQAALGATATRLSTEKDHDTSLTQTLGQIASKYGCEKERICCKTAKPLDGLEDWAQAFLDADAKPFADAAHALRTAPAKGRAAACARVNSTLDELERATREKLAKQTADATADEQRAKDAQTAARRDRDVLIHFDPTGEGNYGYVLTKWRDALAAGSAGGSDATSASAALEPVRAKLADYVQKCR